MKTIEEKAKAYDEAIKRAKAFELPEYKSIMTSVFPELKESEDEKIRKSLITFFQRFPYDSIENAGTTAKEALAWLKKQGEQNFDYEHADIPQKDFSPIKSKFKVRDWLQYRNAEPFFVEEITEQGYCNGDSCLPFEWEDEIHLWTIQDAKDGDVLVASDGSIFLFAGVVDCACKYYVALATDNHVEINKEAKGGYWETSRAVHPATKEQRVLLFEKMKEAGWEWDAEKKELKKTYKTT